MGRVGMPQKLFNQSFLVLKAKQLVAFINFINFLF